VCTADRPFSNEQPKEDESKVVNSLYVDVRLLHCQSLVEVMKALKWW
jgi:hypothetical protein